MCKENCMYIMVIFFMQQEAYIFLFMQRRDEL